MVIQSGFAVGSELEVQSVWLAVWNMVIIYWYACHSC